MSSTGRYPGFRAPQGDREIFCIPGAAELPALVEQNRVRPELTAVEWFGRSLAEIANLARREILRAAVDHTRRYADVPHEPSVDGPLIVTGHQAEMFHPGVWLKNFSAAKVARQCRGTAINLIIDSDLCRSTAMRVPTGAGSDLHLEMVPFDKALVEIPFEERRIADRQLWDSFGSRVVGVLHPQVTEPLIENWWPTVVAAGEQVDQLGLAFSQARHQCELNWGSQTLELPQSRICQSEAFRLFALHLFLHAAEFRGAHNRALGDYRTAHKLKNHAQPMPNLLEKQGWIETPFWLWSTADPRRRGVYAKQVNGGVTLSDLGQHSFLLPSDAALAVEALAAWESQGMKLRTRALATTLFARLLLADLFIHGIGGAKYDQVTDHIAEQFFGFSLPPYATISGTLRLPFASRAPASISETELRQGLRNLRFHPELSRDKMDVPAEEDRELNHLILTKRQWVNTPKTPASAAERHQAIKHTNQAMQAYLVAYKAKLEHAIARSKLEKIAAQLRNSREYAYCLFAERDLRDFFAD